MTRASVSASTPVDITGFLSTSVKDPKAAPVYQSAKIFPVR